MSAVAAKWLDGVVMSSAVVVKSSAIVSKWSAVVAKSSAVVIRSSAGAVVNRKLKHFVYHF